jgi:hypothetical protein
MTIKYLSRLEIENTIKNDFVFYEAYEKWTGIISEGGFSDDFIRINKFITDTPHRYIPVMEKHEIIMQKKRELDDKINTMQLPSGNRMLLVHDCTRKFPWFFNDALDDRLVDNTIRYFQKIGDLSRENIINAHGFEYCGDLKQLILRIFFLPFLQSYRDINILLFGIDTFILIDHHFTISAFYPSHANLD